MLDGFQVHIMFSAILLQQMANVVLALWVSLDQAASCITSLLQLVVIWLEG